MCQTCDNVTYGQVYRRKCESSAVFCLSRFFIFIQVQLFRSGADLPVSDSHRKGFDETLDLNLRSKNFGESCYQS